MDIFPKKENAAQSPQEELAKLLEKAGKTVELPLRMIDLSENIRFLVDCESKEFKALVQSVQRGGGVLQTPVVTIVKRGDALRLLCIAGHRRILALIAAGVDVAPVAIRRIDNEQAQLFAALSENLLRQDLHALDIAKALSRLRRLGEPIDELARRIGKNPKTIGHYLKMQDTWPEEARRLIRANPDKFNAATLLILARKKLSAQEVVARLQDRMKDQPMKSAKPRLKRSLSRHHFLDYCREKSLSPRDQELLAKALQDLGFL